MMGKPRFKVVVSDHYFPDLNPERQVLEPIGAEVVDAQCETEEEVIKAAGDADAILNQRFYMTPRVLNALKRCKIIVRYGVGVDNIDIEGATAAGILICNVPDYGMEEVSDHAIAQLLGLIRKIPSIDKTAKDGTWNYKWHTPIYRIKGSTLGIVGLGRIGRAVARKIKPWGLRVLADDPYIEDEIFAANGAAKASLDQVLEESDYVTVHVTLTDETYHMFSYERFKKMKETAYFINTSRGRVVEETGLCQALREGQIAGAALDVMETEPPGKGHPLYAFPNVIITPHIAFYSEQSVIDLKRMSAEEIARVLQGQPPRSPVNPIVMDSWQRS
jgi:D-3-phosphoglycerate dehydrogenase